MKTVLGAAVVCTAFVAPFAWAPRAETPAAAQPAAQRSAAPFPFQGQGSVLGISVRDATAADMSKAGLQEPGGVVVARVEANSAASKAGFKEGDLVVEFDGERVRSARQFARLVDDTPAGRSVKAAVVRDGARRTLDVTPQAPVRASIDVPRISDEVQRKLENLDLRLEKLDKLDDIDVDALGAGGRLGTSLTPLSGQLADYFGVKRGVLVSAVDINSPAARAGLKAGDVITAVNGHEVSTPRDVRREVRDAGSGGKVELRVTRDKKALTLSAVN